MQGIDPELDPRVGAAWRAMCRSKRDRGTPLGNKTGSPLYRDYCVECGEPLRVTQPRLALANYCEVCFPDYTGVSGRRGRPDPEDAPSWHNAVRAMEGG